MKFEIHSTVAAKNGNTRIGGQYKTREAAEKKLARYLSVGIVAFIVEVPERPAK